MWLQRSSSEGCDWASAHLSEESEEQYMISLPKTSAPEILMPFGIVISLVMSSMSASSNVSS